MLQNLRGNLRRPLVWCALLTVLSTPLLFGLLPTTLLWARLVALCILVWWVPGALLVARWQLKKLDLPTALAYALALGLCWMILIVLILYWLPGPIRGWQLLGAYQVGLLSLVLSLPPNTAEIDKLESVSRKKWIALLAILLFAIVMRFPGLGYHELHVDEVYILYRAQQAIGGGTELEPDPLAIHTKGPGEIAMAMSIYRGLGTVDESSGRFAYALASVGSVFAITLLGWRIFAFPVGLWAGVLLAVNGFALGLSRIVQYQGVILLLTVTAVLAAWEFAQRGDRNRLVLAATLSTFGVIMHYEFALMAPLLLLLVWLGWQRNRTQDQSSIWPAFFGVGLAGAAFLAATYLPFFLNPHFETTQSYLGNRVGSTINFNLPFFIEIGTFYNSIYYFVGLILLMLAGLLIGCFSPTGKLARLLLLIWFLPYFILYIFVMQFPGTHFYQFMPSWSLLAALPLAYASQSPQLQKPVRLAALALIVGWLALSANYLRLIFFQQQPEYVTNYQKVRNPLYWAPYGQQIPQKPRFGFPIERGWKALGTLAAWDYLGDTYATNDRSGYLRRWYLTHIERVPLSEDPRLVFITRPPQQADLAFDDDVMEGIYHRAGEVQVHGAPRIEIWSREALPVPYITLDAAHFEQVFEQQVVRLSDLRTPETWLPPQQVTDWLTLQSATQTTTTLRPSDVLYLQLRWQPQVQPTTDYKLFVHVADDTGRPLAQWDGYPGMNLVRTTSWAAREPFHDHVLLPLPAEMPAGSYQILVGLYDPATGERVGGQSFKVGEVRVRQ